jgi:hypothetical protein
VSAELAGLGAGASINSMGVPPCIQCFPLPTRATYTDTPFLIPIPCSCERAAVRTARMVGRPCVEREQHTSTHCPTHALATLVPWGNRICLSHPWAGGRTTRRVHQPYDIPITYRTSHASAGECASPHAAPARSDRPKQLERSQATYLVCVHRVTAAPAPLYGGFARVRSVRRVLSESLSARVEATHSQLILVASSQAQVRACDQPMHPLNGLSLSPMRCMRGRLPGTGKRSKPTWRAGMEAV